MGFIGTFIDLSQGMLFVESPRCKERLQIRLELDVYVDVKEEIELYGQRNLLVGGQDLITNMIECKNQHHGLEGLAGSETEHRWDHGMEPVQI
uniref:Molybdenum cofactor sulfurase n=1 Tax=Cajanus cajan TaxID=3821 RepID=A0A151RMJ8_CAJCA|nr:Molybdenum cofactor sulfurase [Cajanus cajan]